MTKAIVQPRAECLMSCLIGLCILYKSTTCYSLALTLHRKVVFIGAPWHPPPPAWMKPECERQPANSPPIVSSPTLATGSEYSVLPQSIYSLCSVMSCGVWEEPGKEEGLNEIDVVNVPGPLLSMSCSALGTGPNAEPPSSQMYSPRRLREVLLVGTCCSERAVTLVWSEDRATLPGAGSCAEAASQGVTNGQFGNMVEHVWLHLSQSPDLKRRSFAIQHLY